jgi:hypothetical protein
LSEIDHNNAVRQITMTLKGPVAATFRTLVPSFAELSGEAFYDTVLGSSDLLHGCLLIFRKRRDAFADLLVDSKGRTVGDDFVRLKCGRSVHDIIGMLVRTHAKRHFHATLGGDPNDPRSRAGKLYQAINEYLIHEWQVPLVTAYAALPVDMVARMGPALLEMKTAEAVTGTQPAAAPAAPAPARAAPKPTESHSQEADFWWDTLNDPQVRQALGNLVERDMRELIAAFCALNEASRQLLATLGLSLYQAAVLLGISYQGLGRAGFSQVFGKPGNPGAIGTFAGKLKAKGVSSRSDVRSLARLVEGTLSQLPRGTRMSAA